jgi:uncharacterized glyoxalase superfamily protein PhnB
MADPRAHGAPRVLAIAPQFLVDDLAGAIDHYRERLGFALDFQYEDFYAAVRRGETVIHLKHAPKSREDRALRETNDHLDAYIVVQGVAALHTELLARGARVISPLKDRPWGRNEFWVMDAEGYILAFSEPTA